MNSNISVVHSSCYIHIDRHSELQRCVRFHRTLPNVALHSVTLACLPFNFQHVSFEILVSVLDNSRGIIIGCLRCVGTILWQLLFAHKPQLVLKQFKSAPDLSGIRALVYSP